MRPLIDVLVPPRCLACADVGPVPFCPTCADGLQPDGQLHRLAPGVHAVAAFAYGGALASAIKAVKSGGMREGARALARLVELPDAPLTTWVPAPAGRRRRRGLDLPEVLAGPGAVRLLRRTGRPPEQPDLTVEQRLSAQTGTFVAAARAASTGLAGRPVVLVDDVRATGSTLLAAAGALRVAGAGRILGLTLAASEGPPSAAVSASADRL